MKKNNIRFIAESAIIAALYVALTWLLAPISYGAIQFRISEILILLVVFNPKYAYALVIGCFVANTTSSLGWYDMVFGTLATLLAVLPMIKIKRLTIAAIFPVISNAIIVAIELYLAFSEPIWFSILTVGFGEAVVLYFIGIPAMITLAKNPGIVELMELDVENQKLPNQFTITRCISFIIGALAIIFYVAYPLTSVVEAEETVLFSALKLTSSHPWMACFAVLGGCWVLAGIFLKKKMLLIVQSLLILSFIAVFIVTGVQIEGAYMYPYYYGYLVYILILVGSMIYVYRKSSLEVQN